MSFEFREKKNLKIELSHTSQVENPDHVIHFLHCNKGNKMRPYRGLNGDMWLAFSLHPTNMKSTCQAAERGPLVSWFVIPFVVLLAFHLNFSVHSRSGFVISLPPQGTKDWIFTNSTQM